MTTLRFLAPGTRAFFGDEGGSKKSSGGAPQKITTKSDYDGLKPGDQYAAPDGSIRTKQ
jgi:hypothetical protein